MKLQLAAVLIIFFLLLRQANYQTLNKFERVYIYEICLHCAKLTATVQKAIMV